MSERLTNSLTQDGKRPAPLSNRNVLINGDMKVSQRGTSATATGNTFLIDRWIHSASGSNTTIQDTASVPTGFKYAWKWTSGGSGVYNLFAQQIEYQNFIGMVGKTVTLSFYAKANTANAGSTAFVAATRTSTSEDTPVYFSGTYTPASFTLTTSWVRYSTQFTIGATVKSLAIEFQSGSASATVSTDGVAITGVQLEVGSVATPFEYEDFGTTLVKCQRYYIRQGGDNAFQIMAHGIAYSTTVIVATTVLPVKMRVKPTSVEFSTIRVTDNVAVACAVTAVSIDANSSSSYSATAGFTVASGLTSLTFYFISGNNSINSYLGFSAEL